MKNRIILLLTLISIAVSAQDSIPAKKRIISFSPQYLINYGVRLDFERKISPNKYLVIAPQLYLAEQNNKTDDILTDIDDFNLLAGTGLAVSIKNFALKDGNFGAYLGYGLFYNYYYTEYFEDAEFEPEEVKANIHKMGFDIILGYQLVLYDVAIVDIYTGMAARKSFIDNGDYSDERFTSSPLGYNLTGNIFLLGIKIGIMY